MESAAGKTKEDHCLPFSVKHVGKNCLKEKRGQRKADGNDLLAKAVRVFRSFGNRQEIRLGLSFQKDPTIVPLNSDILNAGFDFIRRSRAFVMGTTCMFSASFQ